MTDESEDKLRAALRKAEAHADEVEGAATAPAGRRPIAMRNTSFAKKAADHLVTAGVTPNQISLASMGAAALAFGLLWWAGLVGNALGRGLLLLLAACFVQARLLCNLLDGMVAVEGGQKEPDGAFWNEFPDRVADILILGGLGLAAGHPGLGFLAAALAVCTAYVRELGRANGAAADYSGPMAKQHRMAAVTGLLVLATFWPIWGNAGWLLHLGLWLILAGTALTVALRSRTLIEFLNKK